MSVKEEGFYSARGAVLCMLQSASPDCFILRDDDNRNIFRHCERSGAIHARTLDCFASYLATPRNDGAVFSATVMAGSCCVRSEAKQSGRPADNSTKPCRAKYDFTWRDKALT
jgi:hypothetical protein